MTSKNAAAPDGRLLETEAVKEQHDIGRCLQWARGSFNKGLTAQVAEIFSLSRGEGKLTPQEYYYFGLCDDGRYTPEEKRRFAGMKATDRIYARHISPYFHGIAHDKLLAYGALEGFEIPVPRTLALFHPYRTWGEVPVFKEPGALAEHLRGDMIYPFFSKPIGGYASLGIAAVQNYDSDSDSLILADQREVPLESFVDEIAEFESGALFQEVLQPHPFIAEASGGRVSSVRLILLVRDSGPEVYRAVWKVMAGANMADNFWRPGNLLAAVDPETGTVLRVIRGSGPAQEEIEAHPETGAQMKGLRLPDWNRLCALGATTAAIFPELRIVALDIALCPQGPMVIEVNIGGALNLPQLASGKGILEPRFLDFLDEVGKPRKIYGC